VAKPTLRFHILLAIVLGFTSSISMPALAGVGFDFQAADQGAVQSLETLTSFETTITNTGTLTDTLTVTLTRDMPADWVTSMCEGSTCYPPFITQITVVLAPGADTALDVDITPMAVEGDGTALVTVVSRLEPTLSKELSFTIVTPNLDVLIVAADGGAGLESYYAATLSSSGWSHGVWPREQAGPLAQAELTGFGSVIWFSGTVRQGLESTDLGPLAYYVQHGGGLLLSGQNMAWAGSDPASSQYAPATVSWFQNILGTEYLADNGGDDFVTGVTDDPVSDGFTSALTGGTGANANSSPDAITTAGGTTSLTYQNDITAAVRNIYGVGHTFFCAFGCENLATATAREDLIIAALNWFNPPTGVILPTPRLLMDIHPNPFNPAVSINWDLPKAAPLFVTVHDLAGRRVAILHEGMAAAGPGLAVWRGTNESGRNLPSGTYICRLQQGRTVVSRKMTLVR